MKATAAGSTGMTQHRMNTGSAVTSLIHGQDAGPAKTITQTHGNIKIAPLNGTGPVLKITRPTFSNICHIGRMNMLSHQQNGKVGSQPFAATIGVTTSGNGGNAKTYGVEKSVPVRSLTMATGL